MTIMALYRLGVYSGKGIIGMLKKIRSKAYLLFGRNEMYYKNKIQEIETSVSASDELGCVISVYKEKDVYPKTAFASSVDMLFEGHMFSAPAGYDVILRQLYGDYMKLPPVEQRVSHGGEHAFRKQEMR